MYINLTPHKIKIGNVEIPPSGSVARCLELTRMAGEHEGVKLVYKDYGEISGLPPARPGVLLIVSAMVRQAVGRSDLASPGDLVRDGNGNVVGCANLVINPGGMEWIKEEE